MRAVNITELKKIISKGESETLEFKKTTTQLKRTGESLCGFLNCNGGIVVE